MDIEYGKEPKLHEVDQSKKEELQGAHADKVQQLLEDKIKYLERKYREKNKPNGPDPEVLKDLLYQLAKAIRNVEGKGAFFCWA